MARLSHERGRVHMQSTRSGARSGARSEGAPTSNEHEAFRRGAPAIERRPPITDNP